MSAENHLKIINTDTLLILEKNFEIRGQENIESLYLIEQMLIKVIERINKNHPELRTDFIVRRLPTFTTPFVTKNDYGIILENIKFTLLSQNIEDESCSTFKKAYDNIGETQIYKDEEIESESKKAQLKNTTSSEFFSVNSKGEYNSKEIFDHFYSTFQEEFFSEQKSNEENKDYEFQNVQIIGPHLLHPLKTNAEVKKILKLHQPIIPLHYETKNKIELRCEIDKFEIFLVLNGTEVRLRPCIFLEKGHGRISNGFLERVPLYHPLILTYGAALSRGSLLFPKNNENLWSVENWPAESHIINKFHNNSLIMRIFKLFSAFVCNPFNFLECLNSSFLIGGIEDCLLDKFEKIQAFNMTISLFLGEVENFPNIQDWEPRKFSTRLTRLLDNFLKCLDRGVHLNYFTKENILNGLQKKNRGGNLDVARRFESDDYSEFNTLEPSTSRDNKRKPANMPKDINEGKVSKSFSKYIGAQFIKRLSMGEETHSLESSKKRSSSMRDIASSFEGIVNEQRRKETVGNQQMINLRRDDDFGEEVEKCELFTSQAHLSPPSSSSFLNSGTENIAFIDEDESIYSTTLHLLHEISPSHFIADSSLILYLDNCRKVLSSQGEIIDCWTTHFLELKKPPMICPHSFSERQLRCIGHVVKNLGNCLGGRNVVRKLPGWEVSGEILRIVLGQLRAETDESEGNSRRNKANRTNSLKRIARAFSFTEGSSNPSEFCKTHSLPPDSNSFNFPLQEPSLFTTNRLLHWLWQLRTSQIPRLAFRAEIYLAKLYEHSLLLSHFIDEVEEGEKLENLALSCAVAVSRLVANEKYEPITPLSIAGKRGWGWADMLISLVGWNEEKGNCANFVKVQIEEENGDEEERFIIRELRVMGKDVESGSKSSSSSTEVLILALHSEGATPIGWNDFEDPRRPGPCTVPILIFSSNSYFNQWELIDGNIVEALVRLQKFPTLQHIANILQPPHKKVAINELRKLNKTLTLSTFIFDDNVMTKTFRRLASLRNTRSRLGKYENSTLTCEELGCGENQNRLSHTLQNTSKKTTKHIIRSTAILCTKF